jgi:hypothetical protein
MRSFLRRTVVGLCPATMVRPVVTFTRSRYSDSSSRGVGEFTELEITVETVTPAAGTSSPSCTATTTGEGPTYTEISKVDPFSRSRVTNFFTRRNGGEKGPPRFETTIEVIKSRPVYTTRVRLNLPNPHGVKIAHGVAETIKDSEVLATMHAERIIDCLGLPLYQLPRMQTNHATQVKADGRWAPMPGETGCDPAFADGDALPPGLRMLSADLRHGDIAPSPAVGILPLEGMGGPLNHIDPTEAGFFQLVNMDSFRFSPDPDTLQFPHTFDKACISRVRSWFEAQGQALESALSISHVTVPGLTNRMFVSEIKLPTPAGETLFAQGKAADKVFSTMLAAMHAELLMDAHAVPLFPNDAERQASHERTAASYGRVFGVRNPSAVLPLKELPSLEAMAESPIPYRTDRSRSESEDVIALHNEWADRVTGFVNVNPDPQVLREARQHLQNLCDRHGGVVGKGLPNVFIATQMGDYVKASTLLPGIPSHYGPLGGNGVGRTVEQAQDLAALHALSVLCDCGVPLFTDIDKHQQWQETRKRLGLSPTRDEPTATTTPTAGFSFDGPIRPLPFHGDVAHVVSLGIDDFSPVAEHLSSDDLINQSVEFKSMIQTYCRRTEGRDVLPTVFTSNRGQSGQSGRRAVGYNVVFLPLYLPSKVGGGRILAMGISLKKRDADRCCFLHAVQLLEAFDVDPYTAKGSLVSEAHPRCADGFVMPPPLRHPTMSEHMLSLTKQQEEARRIAGMTAAAKKLYRI